MTALENVRNFIIVISLIRLIVSYTNDGKPQPLYSFKKSLMGMCIAYVIYYFLGLFS
jgi:hypothetical protein